MGKTHTALSWLAAYPQFFGRLARHAQKAKDEENYTIFDSLKTIAKGGNQNWHCDIFMSFLWQNCSTYFDILTKEITESVDNLQKVGKMQSGILTTNEDGSLLRSGEAQITNLMSSRMSAGAFQGYLFLFEKNLLICQTKLEVDGVNKSYTFLDDIPIEVFESKIRRENEIEISKRETNTKLGLVFESNDKMLQWMQRFMRVMQDNPKIEENSIPSSPWIHSRTFISFINSQNKLF